MARPRLSSPEQAWPLRWSLRLYEFLASLGLAVVVIAAYAALLAYATFVESYYGDKSKAVNYAVYETWWFAGLNLLLAANVLCAALIRFPWKRAQIGFLTTHTGILLLLFGASLTRQSGVDAMLSVAEGKTQWRAIEDSQYFKLAILPEGDTPSAAEARSTADAFRVPFVAGPFNWDDYATLSWFPWALARRDRGVLHDRDGIRLEVLDYYADSTEVPVPRVTLRVDARPEVRPGSALTAPSWKTVELAVGKPAGPHGAMRRYGLGRRETLDGGQRVVFWMTADPGETAAFRQSQPEQPLGPLGQIVLWAVGKRFVFPVDKLQPEKRHPLGDTGLEIELVRLEPQLLGVILQVYHGNDPPQRLVLLADMPEHNHQDYRNQVFGQYWLDPRAAGKIEGRKFDAELLAEAAAPRIDILQGSDQQLYCRAWRAPRLEPPRRLPDDRTLLAFWEGTETQLSLGVEQFLASPLPGAVVMPLRFLRDKHRSQKEPRTRVRLTVDGRGEEFWLGRIGESFWLTGTTEDPEDFDLPAAQRRIVQGRGRRVALTLSADQIDVGFQVRLQKFNRFLDPGSGTASHYSSLVDFLARHDDRLLARDVLIPLNEPVNFSDPVTRRSFRLYQSSFGGPFVPGDPQFDQIVAGGELRDRLYISHLAVNYDPGRGWKYAGSLLAVVGVILVFYMKAVFLRRRHGRRRAAAS